MKKSFIAFCLLAFAGVMTCHAQVDNYALKLQGSGSIQSTRLVEMEGKKSYTVQFWLCPETWTNGASVFTVGNSMSAKLGASGTILFNVGTSSITATSNSLQAGQWAELTLVVNDGSAKVLVDGTEVSTGNLEAFADGAGDLTIGDGFNGRIDDVRFWKTALTDEFNYFWNNTLNQFNPNWDDLVVYYKFDQDLCDNVVDYKSVYTKDATYNHHAQFVGDATREKVTDNTKLPYLLNGAYSGVERFFDRSITREQYLLSNDLIILGVQLYNNGHLKFLSPCNHATFENAEYMSEYNGRTGVISLKGEGARMNCGKDAFLLNEDNNLKATGAYTFETWIYLEKWTEGAYIFRKASDDNTKGFSIRLGAEDTKQVIVRIDDQDFVNQKSMKVGEWGHFALRVNAGDNAQKTFGFMYNGNTKYATTSLSTSSTDYEPTGCSQYEAYIGENLDAKLDETIIWNNRTRNSSDVSSDMNGTYPMPALGKEVTAETMMTANSLYKYDDAENPGYDSYSQDEWTKIMRSAYDGYRGYNIRMSVQGCSDWYSTITSAAKRQTIAEDMAKLGASYDGVELDLEFPYSISESTTLAALVDSIKAHMPGKSVMISNHAYAYIFPSAKMSSIDGFTVQQYSIDKTCFGYTYFKKTLTDMLNSAYGYTKDKIYASYSTVTSKPYVKGVRQDGPFIGVKDDMMGEGFVPQTEMDSGEFNDATYYFAGPLQTYNRAKYVQDNGFKGIFYWDMGNDVKPNNKYCLAKWCSYGLNANVDTLVTHVDVLPYEAAQIVEHRTDAGFSGQVTIYNLAGIQVKTAATKEEGMDALPRGLYMIVGRNREGKVVSEKVMK